METTRNAWRVASGLLLALGSAGLWAQPVAEPAPAFGAPVTVYSGTQEYVWTLYTPVLTTERVPVVVRVPTLNLRGRRWDYELPTLKSQRFKLGEVAEFSCKYSDLGLPQTCRTQWHSVYADLPQLAMERDHLYYDAVEWRWEDQTLHIDVPHWTWKAGTLTVSVPTIGPRNVQGARASLDLQQAGATAALDQAIATLDASIAAVEAQGADPRQLRSGATRVDLAQLRQVLRAEKAHQLEQFSAVRGELDELAAAQPEPGAAPTGTR
jgi:hypothetical protein